MEWPADKFPEFCTGMTYIMSPENTQKILASFEATMRESYIWMEDVYITGILAGMNNIKYSNIKKLTHYSVPNNNTNFMTAHVKGLKPQEWIQIWHEIFDSEMNFNS